MKKWNIALLLFVLGILTVLPLSQGWVVFAQDEEYPLEEIRRFIENLPRWWNSPKLSADSEERKQELLALEKDPSTEARDQIIECLQDPSMEVRIVAAEILGRRKETRALFSLMLLLENDSNRYVRLAVICSMDAIGDSRASSSLLKIILSEPYRPIREEAIDVFGRLKNGSSTDRLLAMADSPKTPLVMRLGALEALRVLFAGDALPVLKRAAGDENSRVRAQVARTLGSFAQKESVDILYSFLEDDADAVRRESVESLGKLRVKESEKFITPLLYDEDYNVRLSVVTALGRIGNEDAIAPLIKILSDSEEKIGLRARAADSLGNYRREDVTTALGEALLNAEDSYVRARAVASLGEIGDERGADFLKTAIKTDLSGSVRASAMEELISLPFPEERRLPLFLDLFAESGDRAVRVRIASLLGEALDQAINNLWNLLEREGVFTSSLISLLAHYGGDSSAKRLLALSQNPAFSDYLRSEMIGALGAVLSNRGIINAFRGDLQEWRVLLIGALRDEERNNDVVRNALIVMVERVQARGSEEVGTLNGIDLLIVALEDSDADNRLLAADALGRHGANSEAIDALQRILSATDSNYPGRWRIEDAIAKVRDRKGAIEKEHGGHEDARVTLGK